MYEYILFLIFIILAWLGYTEVKSINERYALVSDTTFDEIWVDDVSYGLVNTLQTDGSVQLTPTTGAFGAKYGENYVIPYQGSERQETLVEATFEMKHSTDDASFGIFWQTTGGLYQTIRIDFDAAGVTMRCIENTVASIMNMTMQNDGGTNTQHIPGSPGSVNIPNASKTARTSYKIMLFMGKSTTNTVFRVALLVNGSLVYASVPWKDSDSNPWAGIKSFVGVHGSSNAKIYMYSFKMFKK